MQRISLNYIGTAIFLLASGLDARADGVTISVMPASQNAALNATINVAIGISGLGDHASPSVGAFDLNVDFDSSILSLQSAVFGDPILLDQLDPSGLGNTITFDTASVGSVELFDLSLDSASDLNNLQAPSFIVADLTFDAIGSGVSPLSITINALSDADGNLLSAVIENGTIDITPSATPEPLGAGLIPAAMTLIVVFIRRRDRFKDLRRRLLNGR